MNNIVIAPVPSIQRLLNAFLAGRKASTLRAYRQDLLDFAGFLGVESIESAARHLLTRDAGHANGVLLDYQHALLERRLAPNTVNRRIAALRSLVKLARMLGLVTWETEVQNVPSRAYRDTRGPGKEGVRRMLGVLASDRTPKGYRDTCIIHLLFDLGLRRGEVAALNLSDLDVRGSRLRITGKGRSEPEWLTLPRPTLDALIDWLVFRGLEPGPVFHNLDRTGVRGRLSDNGIYRLVCAIGRRASLGHVRPHGLRHAAITHALDQTNGNIRAAAKFARHKQVNTTLIYDDARQDIAGSIATLVAE